MSNVNGDADWGKRVTCTVSRNGDLIHRMYLRVKIPDVAVKAASGSTSYGFKWLPWLGHLIIRSCECEIGGQRIGILPVHKNTILQDS